MPLPRVVAIDGPAGSGKSVVAQALARRLGYFYYDTGALYRAVTFAALRAGLDLRDEAAVTRVAEGARLELAEPTATDGRQYTVLVDGIDATWEIFRPEVEANVSIVSAHPGVRQVLLRRQREAAERGSVVMAGRDIGTVVYPEADLKLYLEATPEVRAERRVRQKQVQGVDVDYEEVLAQIQQRDRLDQSRAVAPLRAASDAIVIETSHLSLDEELQVIEGIIEGMDS